MFCWNNSKTFNDRPYAVNPDACPIAWECISQYRIHDGFADCINNIDEEKTFNNDYCTGNVERHRFRCYNDQNKCLSLFWLGSGISRCSNNYDEMWYGSGLSLEKSLTCEKTDTADCARLKTYIRLSSIKNSSIDSSLTVLHQNSTSTDQISFQSYCDSFWDLSGHNDELTSSCQNWVCSKDQYQCRTGQCIELNWVCDGEWDCADASDEEALVLIGNWSIHNARLLGLNNRAEQYAKRYSQSPFSKVCNISIELGCYLSQVSNPLDINLNRPCINLTKIGDGIEDCFNAYDEKNTIEARSRMWGFHYRCEDSINLYHLACHRITNCSKVLCSNHRDQDGLCSNDKDVICLGSNECKKKAKCDGTVDCEYGEDEYWCIPESFKNHIVYCSAKEINLRRNSQFISTERFPIFPIPVPDQRESENVITKSTTDPFVTIYSYQCNRGVAILERNETRCLCPPAYYGDWCEFFSDRISIIAHIDHKTMPKIFENINLKIRTNLLFDNETIEHHEFIVIPSIENTRKIKHKFYLVYSRSHDMLVHKRWRYFNQTDVLNHHPYSVHFDVFSLRKNNTIKEVGSWHYPIYFDYLPAFRLAAVLKFPPWFGNATLDPCLANSCNNNSTCMPVFNQNHSYYCLCKSGYYGKDCSWYEPRCEHYCADNALCHIDKYDSQIRKANPSCLCTVGRFGARCYLKYDDCDPNPCLNNGTCLSTYDRSGEVSYICNCSVQFYENECQNEKASVNVTLNMTFELVALATVVQLYDIAIPSLMLLIQHQRVTYGFPSTITYNHPYAYAPYLGVLKVYEDLVRQVYFIMYLLHQSEINITTSPERCPHASSLLHAAIDQSVPDVFKYHHICQNDGKRFCFHDENYLCICQPNHYRTECFGHNIQLDHCDNCLSGGKCVQGDRNHHNDFICLCSSCQQGLRCEFSLQPFSFTLDLLLSGSKEVKVVYVSIALLIFTIGLFNNFCSFVTFKRPSPRKFGTGNYLLVVTCFNQVALLCLLLKFIEVTFGISTLVSCKIISFSLSVFTRSTYWLTSWITIDRLLIMFLPTSRTLKNPHLAIGISVGTSIILLFIHIHEMIYYTIIQDLSTGSSVCAINFKTSLLSTYNRISTLIHYLVPFFIQVVCITLLIFQAARSRVKTTGARMTFGHVLKNQFQIQKELYITPIIIVLSSLPQTILTFSLACTSLAHWQRRTLLGAYLLSYAPQAFGFILYVLPSTVYKKEFVKTSIGKSYFKLA
ncbi:unnamed protein product [Rotaria magnacalcarata]|uniref:Uncharacterized protein n=1 Tax=Rotaria magnacalcarata TaxID=392030 RepID=A0A816ZRU5_9BILA|nr:unnamed protein product [Rotaria magnacalcarata]